MSTKIRLARHGRKGRPFYHVVIADSRAPRDGRYIEKIGTYNPNTNPATIDLKFDRALYWLMTGAQPTDTASRILSYKGVLLKKHLLEGVKKGAFDEAAAEAKFEAWMKEKEAKISSLQGEKASIESMLVNAKSNTINDYLNNSSLANASASDLASERKLSELNNYVLNNIQQEETNAINEKIKDLKNEIVNIDNAISELENIKNNMKK